MEIKITKENESDFKLVFEVNKLASVSNEEAQLVNRLR